MSSGITLSAATRQNLLSLQGTADLLSTTQNRLSTGKKVNSALDSPVNFFTAQSLNSRSSGLSSLLDGIGNGIQTIQAANKGITSLTKLTDQLKSTAQQALSATSAFTAKASLTSTALTGAVDSNLLSTGPTQAVSTALGSGTATRGVKTGTVDLSTTGNITTALGSGKAFQIDGVDISIKDTGAYTTASLATEITSQLAAAGSTATVGVSTNFLAVTGSTDGAAVSITGADAASLFGATPGNTTANVLKPVQATKVAALGFADGDTFSVNGSNVTVSKSDTLATLSAKVVVATNGEVKASFSDANRQFTFEAKDAKTSVNLGNGSTATALVANLGYTTTTQFASGKGNGTASALNNDTLTVTVGTGTTAKTASLSFGTGAGQISTLDQLNEKLGTANAQATIDSAGKISISTTNDSGSQDLSVSGTATGTGNTFLSTSSKATIGGDGLTARNKLVTDYNNLLTQIDQLSNDSGFNGVNLLKGDQLKVSFNEAQSSSITVQGKATSSDTLGLKAVTSENFKDNASINEVFSSIRSAGDSLKSQASTYASNLSVVQNRQDFSKNLISVLDTGSANLTNADLNEEAANSQALSTRNSLAISALGLANTAQQGILQLLR
ncbi:flagellar hook protein [Methylobacterium sp. Leaf102]|uniref:flagellin N-terminal helical domain-containing protein n=1 Tax=Methylobacterium sp. Leaf102 TaxID=1736253 RepID=UPI0006FA3AED|nr:flagellar hook protein [Methylobacterium sp. Leaf102]KQP25009.1 flagellar hook protein [Methylobacterium sp. Leaf102]